MKKYFIVAFFLIGLFCLSGASAQTVFKFDFGTGKAAQGYRQVLPDMFYTKERGYGFMVGSSVIGVNRKGKDDLSGDFCTSEKPFFFTVDIPEGNYNVSIIFGDKKGTSLSTVKVENRRLMLEKIVTQKGEFQTKTFTVNVRNAQINGTDRVKLKPRELNYLHWDNQLTFEFSDDSPKVCGLEITPAENVTTVFLAGNSTVVDQTAEPFAAWGQMFPRFFKAGKIVIANHAESGETLRSFISEKRLDKVMSQIKAGDYLFIEFAHNDQKQKDLDPFVGYKDLLKRFIADARSKGAIPVLVTSMHRRNFDVNNQIINTLGNFPEAMRQTAQEENVPLIDLNAMSKTLFEALGPEQSMKAFVHYAANTFPGQDKDIHDDTHFSNYGAYQLAKCIVEGLKKAKLDMAQFLFDGLPTYDPAHPDPIESWDFPHSPLVNVVKPDGN